MPLHPAWPGDFFEDQAFSELELTGADLSEMEFTHCTFRKVPLQETLWKGARLNDCLFHGCDMTRMRPASLAARGVVFVSCRLVEVNLFEG